MGYAAVISWPETLCKQASSWYDPVLKLFRINKNGYYKVGHSAMVLIDKTNGECKYFDFGRYQTPLGYGRVRDAITDSDLKLTSIVEIGSNGIPNVEELTIELTNKEACNGTGDPVLGVTRVDYNEVIGRIKMFQQQNFIPYGPFVRNGTNCSRFVRDAIVAGLDEPLLRFMLKYPWTYTPSPTGLVNMMVRFDNSENEEYKLTNPVYKTV